MMESWNRRDPFIRVERRPNDLSTFNVTLLKAILPFGTSQDGKLGYAQYIFDVNQFPLLIDPLLASNGNRTGNFISFWVYAPFYNYDDVLEMPTYQEAIYKSESGIEITDAIYTELITEIFSPSVFDYEVAGTTYIAYSQRVPPTAETEAEI